MFNFKETVSPKRYRRIKKGWHPARVYAADLKNNRNNKLRQYIRIDFEIIHEKEYKSVLVPGFFSYRKSGKLDLKFLEMGKAAGLVRNYGNDVQSVFRDLIGKELMIYVVHRFKNKYRRERAVDFKAKELDFDR